MLRFLFQRLTPAERRGGALFDAVVALARQPRWYRDAGVADTVDGRFAMLATIAALVMVRLERGGALAQDLSIALTERFIEAMDAEHRQMGINDPTLGRTVRKLVGVLGRKVDQWRGAIGDEAKFAATVRAGLPAADPQFAEDQLRALWARLDRAADAELAQGMIS